MPNHIFRDRQDGGRTLATLLSAYANQPNTLVLALPRGGVPVGYEVAKALKLPLDVLIVRKLGVPGHQEFAMGAIASGGVRVLNDNVVHMLDITCADIETATRRETQELQRRERLYRDARPLPEIRDRIVIIVDDGLATGSTMLAAVRALHVMRPARIVVAVPTAAVETCEDLRREVDEVICATTPEPFHAVGLWYEDFSQTSDQEVHDLLKRSYQLTRIKQAHDMPASIR